MPKFQVAVEWSGTISIEVDAPSMDDAIAKVRDGYVDVPKPTPGDLDWEVDIESSYELTEQANEEGSG